MNRAWRWGISLLQVTIRGTQWLRHCATKRKVAGSILDGVTEILHWLNLSRRTMPLGSTKALTEISTRNICWGVTAAGALGWQPYHIHVRVTGNSGSVNLLEPSGPVQAYIGKEFFRLGSSWNYLWTRQRPLGCMGGTFLKSSATVSVSSMVLCILKNFPRGSEKKSKEISPDLDS